jgi:hypothetical protein
MKEIKLTQGLVALVDDEDFDYLNQWKWYAYKNGNVYYTKRNLTINGITTQITMHSDIIKILDGMMVDHIDHNGLNNQKHNLRLCTHAQNQHNRLRNKVNKTGFKGVYYYTNKRNGNVLIKAFIKINGNKNHIGYFNTTIDAARAYDKKAIELFGEFACTNFPLSDYA